MPKSECLAAMLAGRRPTWIGKPYSLDLRKRVVAAIEGGMFRNQAGAVACGRARKMVRFSIPVRCVSAALQQIRWIGVAFET